MIFNLALLVIAVAGLLLVLAFFEACSDLFAALFEE